MSNETEQNNVTGPAATVSISGADRNITVALRDDTRVAEVLEAALKALRLTDVKVEHFSPVVNGEDADLQDRVPANAIVTGASNGANG